MPHTLDGLEHPLTPAGFGDGANPADLLQKTVGNVRTIRNLPGENCPSTLIAVRVHQATRRQRLGRSVWQTHHRALDERMPRDVPHWLDSSRLFPDVLNEDLPFEEELLPLRYGFQLEPHPGSIAPPARMVVARRPYVNGPADSNIEPALLQFPQGLPPALPKLRTQAAYQADAILPFRTPARQTTALFSLTGGTGRTSIAAGLARLLAGSGLRVLLADTSMFSLLPRLFGGGEPRQGVVRRFYPASGENNRMISMVSLAVDAFAGDDDEQSRILQEFGHEAARMDRIFWDLSGAPLDWAAKVLATSQQILIPLLPNANSLMQLRATERFIHRCRGDDPHLRYVLNGFDEHNPMHEDLRGRFRKLLGGRLLNAAMRSSPLVDEALSVGKTVVDHAPSSPLVDDLARLAQQLNQLDKQVLLPANTASEWVEH